MISPLPLFTYGSLTHPEVLHILLGRLPASKPAEAPNHQARALPDKPYPVLVPTPEATTRGVLLTDLTEQEKRLLDVFEGPIYMPTEIAVLTDQGSLEATAYAVTVSEAENLRAKEPWSQSRLIAEMRDFLEDCERFRKTYEE